MTDGAKWRVFRLLVLSFYCFISYFLVLPVFFRRARLPRSKRIFLRLARGLISNVYYYAMKVARECLQIPIFEGQRGC